MMMSEKRFTMKGSTILEDGEEITTWDCCDVLNEQQEQLDLYKEAILTMLGLLADKGIIFSGVKDE